MHPKALLDACAELIGQVLKFEHPADAVVARYGREHRALGPRERQIVSDTVYALLREKPRLLFLARHEIAPTGTPLPRRLALLAFQGPAESLDRAADEAERAWLAACARVALDDMPPDGRHLLPQWLAQTLQVQVGESFEALAGALNRPAPLDVRVNPLKAKRAHVLEALAQAGLKAQPTPYSPWGVRIDGKPSLHKLPVFTEGLIEVQDEGSQLLALLMDARRNEMVADFCAGAGGKTLAMGAAMRNTGRLYALDTSAHRLDALQPRLRRSGLTNVHPMVIAHERDERLLRMVGKMDRVLVDAPCSGLGTLRRSPDLKWRLSPEAVAGMPAVQRAILDSAARLVKPGGHLLYATCSLLREENEAVAQGFAEAHRGFTPVPVDELLARQGVPSPERLCEGGYLRLWPHLHQTDGFFAAVWRLKA